MSRYERPAFDAADLAQASHDEARNRLLFDWWCDEGAHLGEEQHPRVSDRLRYIASLNGKPTAIRSRAALQDDPAPPLSEPAAQGFRDVFLLSKPEHIHRALTDTKTFSNRPYAALGSASFLLAIDPPKTAAETDWHAEQQDLIREGLDCYTEDGLRQLARMAVDQAALTCLARPDFDLAQFAEQTALRYMGQLFGYGFQDHALLEEAARSTYRALQYLAVGQHFVTEPGTVPAAQRALGCLIARTSELADDYTRLARSPRRFGPSRNRGWPQGVQPWSELGLNHSLGEPLLKWLPRLGGPLSGRDRATVAATLLAGTLGNLQSAVCLLTASLLRGPLDERAAVRDQADDDTLEDELERRLAGLPPIPVIPRRTLEPITLDGVPIPANTDCLLLLEGQLGCPHAHEAAACPRIWGDVATEGPAMHACLGRRLALPLIAALVRRTLQLPGLKPALDSLSGDALPIERLWGFACTRYPLRFDRAQHRPQHNLIVSMRVKAPIGENAMRLRRLIAAGVPRIEHALVGFGHVHFAWFEFSDDDSHLVLRTIYDGQFEPYVQHFAHFAGELFDGLFEYLEGAPPRPVSEHPHEFVETLRRHNRSPLAGYLFSAYPSTQADAIRQIDGRRP